jgi:Fe2+ transport system protein FeoA
MKKDMDITCTMCGQHFDPQAHLSCTACPLNGGCNLVCCPHCGYGDVNVYGSQFARKIAKLLRLKSKSLALKRGPSQSRWMSLQHLPRGQKARIIRIGQLPGNRRNELLGYGLNTGRWLVVKQHHPAMVVILDHTEIALEEDLAQEILVVVEP